MKIISGAFGVLIAVSCPLSGHCAYPTLDRAMELFNLQTVSTTNVSMESVAYSQFAKDLRCQTTSGSARTIETFLLNAVTSIVVTVSTNAVDDGTSAFLLYDRGEWFADAAKSFYDLPTNPANCIAVATYLGEVNRVYSPTNLLRNGFSHVMQISLRDPAENALFQERARARRAEYDRQLRVRDTNEAVEEYRKDLLTVCNVGVRGCRAIMDDTQYCVFTNQLATASHASEEELQILFRPQGEGD